MHYLSQLGNILFEPIAILALISFYMIFYRDKNYLIKPIFLIILYAIVWRYLVKIESSRYASILIYPVIIGCAWIINWSNNYLMTKLCKTFIPLRIKKVITVLPLLIITIVCLGKAFHSSGDNGIIAFTKKISLNLSANDIIFARRKQNYSFYLNNHAINNYPIEFENIENAANTDEESLIQIFKLLTSRYKYYEGAIIIIIKQSATAPILTHKLLGLNEADEFSLIAQTPSTKSNEINLVAYLFKSNATSFSPDDTEFKNFTATNNYLPYGNFEGIEYIANPSQILPLNLADFSLHDWGMEFVTAFEIIDQHDEIISGKSSLYFSTIGYSTFYTKKIDRGNYLLIFSAYSKTSKEIDIKLSLGDQDQYLFMRDLSKISLTKTPRQYTVPIECDNFYSGEYGWIHFFVNNGDLVIDDIMIIKQ